MTVLFSVPYDGYFSLFWTKFEKTKTDLPVFPGVSK